MGRADLDMVEAALEAGLLLDKRHWSDLVAELRLAREVIDQARLQSRPHAYLRRALAVYDRHVQHSDDPGSERVGE